MSKNKSIKSNDSQAKEIIEEAENKEEKASAKTYDRLLVRIALWIIFLAVIAGLWIKPEILQQLMARFESTTEISTAKQVSLKELEIQISGLQNQIKNLQKRPLPQNNNSENLKALNERLSNFEKQNIALIDTKADKETIMGVINRLDRLEERLNNLAKISDQGALILSTVMMIKDSAERGNSFEYEAEMLSQLTVQEVQMQNSVRTIASLAHQKIPTKQELQERFAKVHKIVEKAEQEREIKDKNWKERLNMKFQEVVQIKRTNQPQNEQAGQPDLLNVAQKEVDNGRFAQALTLLRAAPKMIAQNPILQEWISLAEINIRFNQAISQLSSSSLALMKLNYVQTKAAN